MGYWQRNFVASASKKADASFASLLHVGNSHLLASTVLSTNASPIVEYIRREYMNLFILLGAMLLESRQT